MLRLYIICLGLGGYQEGKFIVRTVFFFFNYYPGFKKLGRGHYPIVNILKHYDDSNQSNTYNEDRTHNTCCRKQQKMACTKVLNKVNSPVIKSLVIKLLGML